MPLLLSAYHFRTALPNSPETGYVTAKNANSTNKNESLR